mmetsp:Transcript_12204/g.13924  ORF Transcript_12204/g.13924 Transcript_12204/m.13924 type:complete len:155 (+) Transcript_12204:308-772(+)
MMQDQQPGQASNDRQMENLQAVTSNSYPPKVAKILLKWVREHRYFPYPTEEERQELINSTGLSRKQLRSWLTDARRRKLTKIIKSEELKKRNMKSRHKKETHKASFTTLTTHDVMITPDHFANYVRFLNPVQTGPSLLNTTPSYFVWVLNSYCF